MPNLDFLIVCEDVQNTFEPSDVNGSIRITPQIVNPLDYISPYSLPGNYSFALFGSISSILEDGTLSVIIKSPKNEEIFRTGKMAVKKPDKEFESVKFSFNIRNFLFMEEGKYNISIFINENKIGNRDIYVRAQG